MKIVVVGGVAAGASAATKARRVNEDAEIIIFEKGNYVSFANCGLPYYVGGDILEKSSLLIIAPELFRKRYNIDVRINNEVIDIDNKAKVVTVKSPSGVVKETYDKLILATGGKPVKLPIEGIDLEGVHTVFTVNDVEAIAENLNGGISSAVILGGGFIGLETAEALIKKGIKTTVVDRNPQLITSFDPEFSLPLEAHLKERGAQIALGRSLISIQGKKKVEGVILDDGTPIKAEMVIMSAGVRPQLELAHKAGLKVGTVGGVVVDATMQTSEPDIYAAGDIVESVHLVSGDVVRIPLAGSASKQGRVAGANAAGGKLLFKGVLGTSILKVGNFAVARTGIGEKEAKNSNMNYYVAYIPTFNHSTYYPGAKKMIIKIIAEKHTGRILGAQIVGWSWKGVDKRIDVMATAIFAHLTVFDLENLDLAYAPPFASPKDPINVTGMVAANIIRGEARHITPAHLKEIRVNEDIQVVDCRTRGENEAGAIEGSVLIPEDELRTRYQELDKDKKIVLYSSAGKRAYFAYRVLIQKGYNVYVLSGGYAAYIMSV
ncbi:MAG: FAD-dependent oxidoreductase [Clostridia bacterium]|nr:FAD-dependent oxidoreductase [Clostridia bacterium]MDD4048069.1 FAD-dependent oxidoreductase [Clostridia bacterium]